MSRYPFAGRRLRPWTVLLVLAGIVGFVVESSWAELTAPTGTDHQITKIVTTLLRQQHLSRHPLDDEMASRTLTTYLKTLDPMKVYFYQQDIDEFDRSAKTLDDKLKDGDIKFAYVVFNRFLTRVDERAKTAAELIDEKHDFTVDEEMISDPKIAKYPQTEAEAHDLWRKRIKYDLLVQKSDGKTLDEARAKLKRRYASFDKRMHQTDRDELLEMYLTSLTTSFDPHTTYMAPETLQNFEIQMRLELEGIGAALEFDDGYTVVKKIIPGGAADRDGKLKPEDKVVGVGQGASGEIVDVVDMKLSDVVALIRGKRNTVVRLQVVPVGKTDRVVYNITRDEIQLADSAARSEVIEEQHDGKTIKVGVIDLPSFYMDMEGARNNVPDFKSTTRDVAKLLHDFRKQNVDVVMLDLRRNGGGSLTEAINLTGLFIDTGPVVQVKDAEGRVQHYDDSDAGVAWAGPLVVLTSKFSASASEIFAGAIQDYKRGIIVGDHSTHGKGTVQSLMDLKQQIFQFAQSPPLGALKITMQQFYRPDGDSTQNRGVLADVELPSLTTHLDVGESDLDYAMKFDHVDPTPLTSADMVDKSMVEKLNKASIERRKSSDGFRKIDKNVARYLEQKSKKTVTLNEEKFMAERKDLNADKEQEKQLENLENTTHKVVERNDYFNEALNVTLDYVPMAQGRGHLGTLAN